MEKILFLKSHVAGYVKKDGTYVGDYDNKTQKKSPFQASIFGSNKPKPEGFHPKPNDQGKQVPINKLSQATESRSWDDKAAIATVTPHASQSLPEALNGVKFESWHDVPRSLHDWAEVEGQNIDDEPDMELHPKMKQGSGVIIQEDDGRVWVIHPTNAFGGYQSSFPKGTVEDGLPLQASAIKEAYEESGLKVELVSHFMDVVRTTSVARYYLAKRVGGTPADVGWESQAVSLVPVNKLFEVLNMSTDHGIAEKLGAYKKH